MLRMLSLLLLIVMGESGALSNNNVLSKADAAYAYTYYVSTTGSDSNPGSQSQPFLTIGKAASAAQPGTIIHVSAGTYTFSELITATSGTAGNPITYVSDTPGGARLVGTGADRVWEVDGSFNTIQGFDITGTYSLNRLGILTYGNDDIIEGNFVHDIGANYCATGGGGIDLSNTSNYANPTYDSVDSNLLERIGPASTSSLYGTCGSLVQAIYVSTPNNTIQNNVVNGNSGFCIHLNHNPNYNVIANNTVDQCGQSGILIGDDVSNSAKNNVIVNNIARNNAKYGIREESDKCQATGCGSNVGNNTFLNNDTYSNGYGTYFLFGDSDTNAGGLTVDPKVIDYANYNVHLQPTSPMVDTGSSTDAPQYDFDGNVRPSGSGYDIGAYEYQFV